jgi:uncharacterized protein YbjQ (UPF0145 family)
MNDQVMEQAPTPSIEDRAAAAFMNFMGDKPKQPVKQAAPEPETEQTTEAPEVAPDGDSDTTPQTAEEFFEFEHEGQKYALPKPLEKAVMQQRDYTQKTQETSAQRKTLEVLHEQTRVANMQAEFQRDSATELEQLRAYDAVLAQAGQIDWASMSTDEVMRKKIQLDTWKDERAKIAQGLQGKYQEWTQRRDNAVKELRAKAIEAAASAIPGFNTDTQKAVREHAMTEGYTEAELSQADLDPRHWKTLWKAQQFDLLKAKAAKTVSDVKTVKTTPSNPMPAQVKEKLAFNKQMQKAATPHDKNKLVESRVSQMFSKRF